jgi:hypothetical protein
MSLHDTQEFYDDLGGRSDEDLALSTALGVDDVVLRFDLIQERLPALGDLLTRQSF